jgi:hypothetical protein
VDDVENGMGVAPGDFDLDGRQDVVVTNSGHQLHSVYRNAGEPSLRFADGRDGFAPATLGIGLTGWGASWADLDLDTDLDLMLANGAVPIVDAEADRQELQLLGNLTAQGAGGQFTDLTAATGLDGIGPLLARGMAAADYDNDGDLDLAVSSVGGDLALLRSSGAGGHWLGVSVEPFAPGAVVTAELADGTRLVRELHAGSSYLSSEDPRAHFGLGAAAEVAGLSVEWPDGTVTSVEDVAADRYVTVTRRT